MSRALALLVPAYLVALVASIFIMDWFVGPGTSGDLWATSTCSGAICKSAPLDNGSFAFAARATLWSTLAATIAVLAPLAVRRATFARIAIAGSVVSGVLAMVAASHADAPTRTPAAGVLVCAHVIGMLIVLVCASPLRLPNARALARS